MVWPKGNRGFIFNQHLFLWISKLENPFSRLRHASRPSTISLGYCYERKTDTGIIAFEIWKLNRHGRLAKFVYLNEDQSYFALTPSDNTINSVRLKKKLTKEFSAYRKLAKRQVVFDFVRRGSLGFAVALFRWRKIVVEGIGGICDGLERSYPSERFFIVRYFWAGLNFYRLRIGFYIARFLGRLLNYMYRNSVNFQICLNG